MRGDVGGGDRGHGHARGDAGGGRPAAGLAFLDGPATALLRTLDDTFLRWGLEAGAEHQTFPPVLSAADLHSLDYFQNFPHLGVATSRLRPEKLETYSAAQHVGSLPAADLTDAGYLLPSAACYSVYLHLRDTELDGPRHVTTAAHCFRNEERYDGLRRLWGFTMREIVCVGTTEVVRAHLTRHHERLTRFLRQLGVRTERQPATDPFFQAGGSRAFFQKVEPVKEEYVSLDGTAIASMNYHRNFFGERCRITAGGVPAVTGCVAFGLERWVGVLTATFEGDLEAARTAVLRAADEESAAEPPPTDDDAQASERPAPGEPLLPELRPGDLPAPGEPLLPELRPGDLPAAESRSALR
ncbi:class-II aminoacyl-tRNA synthetase family protein [Kineosporia succinea]|uniref:Seryl-tRNA synthetase n=1 Tax=Kineosporia succinea TaxID=84632 RepID=A0ABT9NVE5_9ACTN|nr:hypothetical protein [Kineosporia succinea]MDP9824396.1 seryl-tRNA synthetase [Kineosporia succinea]